MAKYPIIPVAQTLILSCLNFDFLDVKLFFKTPFDGIDGLKRGPV